MIRIICDTNDPDEGDCRTLAKFEDAEQRAYAMLDAAFVSDDSFIAQEPRLLEERP